MTKYAGSEWIKENMAIIKPGMKMSDIGCSVADLLGELYYGIFHLGTKALYCVEWDNTHHIVVTIGWKDWATVDFNTLIRLVFLAHYMAIRVDLAPVKYQYLRMMFHQRNRAGNSYERHPTLDEAVTMFKNSVNVPEYN